MRSRKPLVPLAVALSVALGVLACSNYVKRGSTLYADGRFVEAAEVFERTEHRLDGATPREAADYGLYRGLTLLELGDLPNAHRWLTYAYIVERSHPGSLRGNRRALLDQGWAELGAQMRGEPAHAPAPAQPGTALAASQPPPSPPPPEPTPEPDSNRPPADRALAPE